MRPRPEAPPIPTFPTTSVAAIFAVLAGVMLVYVPYEFSAPLFRYIYPYARLLGTGFLAGGLLLGVSAAHPEWPRWVDGLGRALLLCTLGAFWWNATIRVGNVAAAAVYALMIVCIVAEAPAAWRRQKGRTFLPLVALSAVVVGGMMLALPGLFPEQSYLFLRPWLTPLGALFALAGTALCRTLWRGRGRGIRLLVAGLALPYLILAVGLLLSASWSGAALYFSLASGCVLVLAWDRLRPRVDIRWRLWRGMVIASCIPLIALGAVACVLMQRGLEANALREAQTAADAEVEWLEQHFIAERRALTAHARSPGFHVALRSDDPEVLELSLQVLGYHAANLEASFVLDAQGQVIARSDPKVPLLDDQSDRDFFLQALGAQAVYPSVPYFGKDGMPRVALAIPITGQGGPAGVLVGTMSLSRLSGQKTVASRLYLVQLVDVRSGDLLRETATGGVALPAWLPPPLVEGLAEAEHGTYVGPDARQRQVTAIWKLVPGTPWLVVAHQPSDATYRAITRMGMGATVFVTIGALLALVVSGLVASEVTRRVGRLRAAATALAQGDAEIRVTPEGGDELEALAHAFNRMSDQVQAAQAELRKRNDELKSAVAVRDQFLSLASHELRTPLTPLKATAHSLRSTLTRTGRAPEAERVLAMLDRMDRQTNRLALLVGDMLDTARLQAGRFVLQPGRMDLGALVTEVVERQRSAHPDLAERMKVVRPPGPVEGEWDGPRLEQVVVNLLENAVRYSPEGGEIQVTLEEAAEEVRLTVSDCGIGIPPESLAHLFEPFFRAPNAAEKHFGGLGLGLHICREIAVRHGGEIVAESGGGGKGSRFCLRLPRRAPLAGGEAERAA